MDQSAIIIAMSAEYITLTFTCGVEFPIHRDLLSKIPYFADASTEQIPYTKPMKQRHITIIAKILAGSKIIPTVDLTSHIDVYTVILLSRFLKLHSDVISTGFIGWTDHQKWLTLWDAEYLYLIWNLHEDLVDFPKFFRYGRGIMESVSKAKELDDLKSQPNLWMEMLRFFKSYDYSTCFKENNDKIHANIQTLNKERDRSWEIFLVDPHEDFLTEFFNHSPVSADIWACAGISVIKVPSIGETTIATKEVVKQRFSTFTHGKITESFPYENVVFAGGAIAKMVAADFQMKNARQSDVDMFIIGKTNEERAKAFESVIKWFSGPNTFYALRGSVATIYIKDVNRKFQIISMNNTNPYEVISRFDLTHIQWCSWRGQFLGTPEACFAMKEKLTRFNNIGRLKTNRLVKALHCGYDIEKNDTIAEKFIDITELILTPNSLQMQQIILSFHGFYYPRTEADMDSEEEKSYILSMIMKDSDASTVSADPAYIVNNVVIGGNFENDYESVLFNTFNADQVANRVQRAALKQVSVRSKFGVIKLTTAMLSVVKVVVLDTGLEITARCDDQAFLDFCAMLENTVFRLFRQQEVTRKLLDGNLLKITIPKYKLDRQIVRGVSCLRTQRGRALDIEEDLKPDDVFQMLFSMLIVMDNEDRAVTLIPIKFVKYQEVDIVVEESVENIPEQAGIQVDYAESLIDEPWCEIGHGVVTELISEKSTKVKK